MRIGFIGGGNMAEAIISALLSNKLATAKSITASDKIQARCEYLHIKYGIKVTTDNRLAAEKADVVVLAVKPQNISDVMGELSGKLKPEQLVLSIIAGKRIGTLSSGLKHKCIVRSMPNTPAQIGEGMTAWTATPEVSTAQKEQAKSILGVMGFEIYVDDEGYLDMVTAVSGSGPAYVFLFIESLVAAAVRIGLPADMAEKMVLQTVLGTGHLVQKSGKSPSELRRLVTSPGGTTAEAISQFEKGGFAELVSRAVTAAYEKSKTLGG